MNSKPLLITTLLFACAALLPAQNNNAFYWYNEPEDYDTSITYSVTVPRSGVCKALVLVVEFPDDSTEYMQDSCRYPLWYDTLLAPNINVALNDSNYMWSITDFLKIT
jgi:hypothetical protein